jgi:transposase
MRFYTESHQYYCGVDLHARNLYMCVVNAQGGKVLHRQLPNCPKRFVAALEPYRSSIVVSVESTYNWYWLADVCAREKIPFVLGHALYMRAIHEGKSKNDRIDSEKTARLTAGKMLPQAYVYPRQMRVTRDLLRRRLYYVRLRAAAKGHIEIVNSQYNLSSLNGAARCKSKHKEVLEHFPEGDLRCGVAADLATIEHFDRLIPELERHLVARAKVHDAASFEILQSIDGVGNILAMTLLYEIHHLARFPRVQQFCSYARLTKAEKTSAGKRVGKGGRKIGNPYLKWAFSEATVQLINRNPRVAEYFERRKNRLGKAAAYSLLAHKLGRCVYHMLRKQERFDVDKFLSV